MEIQDWLDKGYKKFLDHSGVNSADFGLQKRFDDQQGKKYFITVWVYDWSKYPTVCQHTRYSFEPDLQFKLPDGMHFNVKLLLDNQSTVDYVEAVVESMWQKLNCQHYETKD